MFRSILFILLFASCTRQHKVIIKATDIKDRFNYRWNEDSNTLVFSSNMLLPVAMLDLQPGKYVLNYKLSGNSALSIQPNLDIALGNNFIKSDSAGETEKYYSTRFELQHRLKDTLWFQFTNDYSSATEDRNLYLHFPIEINRY